MRGTWSQALISFLSPILLILTIRWLLLEPFVIPSGSMLPNLLIHDHIIVNKLAYGIQNPVQGKMAVRWANPKRGDVLVFRYPENPSVFYVKRVIGIPGDRVELREGVILLNGEVVATEPLQDFGGVPVLEDQDEFQIFRENLGDSHLVRYKEAVNASFSEIVVGEGSFFVLGDNRDQSMDSRYWGMVPEKNLIGRASVIWLSCEETLVSAQFLCDPTKIRWNRVLKKVE